MSSPPPLPPPTRSFSPLSLPSFLTQSGALSPLTAAALLSKRLLDERIADRNNGDGIIIIVCTERAQEERARWCSPKMRERESETGRSKLAGDGEGSSQTKMDFLVPRFVIKRQQSTFFTLYSSFLVSRFMELHWRHRFQYLQARMELQQQLLKVKKERPPKWIFEFTRPSEFFLQRAHVGKSDFSHSRSLTRSLFLSLPQNPGNASRAEIFLFQISISFDSSSWSQLFSSLSKPAIQRRSLIFPNAVCV